MIDFHDLLPSNLPSPSSKDYALYFPKLDLIYNYIPKNACSTLKFALASFELGQEEMSRRLKKQNIHDIVHGFLLKNHCFSRFEDLLSRNCFSRFEDLLSRPKFAVIRPPLERLASAFFDKFLRTYVDNISTESFVDAFLKQSGFKLSDISLLDFIKFCVQSNPRTLNDHFKPQSWMLAFESYDLIVPMNSLKKINFLSFNSKRVVLPSAKNVNTLAANPDSVKASTSDSQIDFEYIAKSSVSQIAQDISEGKIKLPSAHLWNMENLRLDLSNLSDYRYDQLVYDRSLDRFSKFVNTLPDNNTGGLVLENFVGNLDGDKSLSKHTKELADSLKDKESLLNESRNTVNALNQKISDISVELDCERKNNNAAIKTIGDLKDQVASIRSKHQTLVSENNKLLESSQKKISEQESTIAEMSNELKLKIGSLEKLDALHQEMETVKSERDVLVGREKDKESLLNESRNTVNALNQKISDISVELDCERKNNNAAIKTIGDLKDQVASIRSKHQTLVSENNKLLESSQKKISEQESTIAEMSNELKLKIGSLEKLDALHQEMETVKSERDVLVGREGELRKSLDDFKNRFTDINAQLENERNEKSQIAANLANLQSLNTQFRQELKSYDFNLEHAKKSCEDHAKERYNLAQQVNTLKIELMKQVQAYENIMNDLTTTKSRLKNAENAKIDYRKEVEITLLHLNQVKDDFDKANFDQQQKLDQLEDLNQKILSNMQSLEQEYSVKSSEHLELEKKNNDLILQLENAFKQIHEKADSLKIAETVNGEVLEENELTILQLEQMQEELDYYYKLTRSQNAVLVTYKEQQMRVQKFLSRHYCA